MRIGIDGSIFRFPKAGIARYLKNTLINLINLAEKEIFFLYSPTKITCPKEIENINLRIGKNLTKKLGSYWFQLEGAKYAFQDKINIFWGQNHILPFKLAKKIPTLVTVHDLSFYYFSYTLPFRSWLIVRSLFWKTIRLVSHIITPSNFVKKSLIHLGIPQYKITVIPEGVDEVFTTLDKDFAKTKVKEKYKIEKDFILSVGTIEPRKNYSLLIRAFKNFEKDFLLIIIGQKGWKNENIFQLVKRLNLEEKVIFLFAVDDEDLCYFYNAATLFIYPSLYEGFGLPVLEALKCGVPTIISLSSSLPEIGGDAVLYFDPSKEQELINQIKKLLASPSLQKELREKGLIRANLFSFKKTAQQILNLMYFLVKKSLS